MNCLIHNMPSQVPTASVGRRVCLALATLLAATSSASATTYAPQQVLTAEVLGVAGGPAAIENFFEIHSDEAGSWVAVASLSTSFDRILFGVVAGSGTTQPSILRTPQTLSGYPQDGFLRARVRSGRVAYTSGSQIAPGTSSWIDDQLIAEPGMVIGSTGLEWTSSKTPRLTTGSDFFVSGFATLPGGGSPPSMVVVQYPSQTVVLAAGDMLPGLSGPVSSIFSFETNPSGTSWIAIVGYASTTTGQEEMAILLDGQLYSHSGPNGVTTEVGTWESFSLADVNDDGEVTYVGRDQLGDLLVRNGVFQYHGIFPVVSDVDRDGYLLMRAPFSSQGVGVQMDGLTLDRIGVDGVDINRDGVADPGWSLLQATAGFSPAVFQGDGFVLARVMVQGPSGGPLSAVVRASLALPANIACEGVASSRGDTAALRAVGSNRAGFNDLQLRMTNVPMGTVLLPLVSRTMGFVANPAGSFGNLCLGGVVGRGIPIQAVQGARQTLRMYPSFLPQPNGLVAAQPGETWYFQVWYRDTQMGAVGSNFSSAIGVTFR